jgi:hypothetical protein
MDTAGRPRRVVRCVRVATDRQTPASRVQKTGSSALVSTGCSAMRAAASSTS